MIYSKKIAPHNITEYWQAWQWMHLQPSLYAEQDGYNDFRAFCEVDALNFALYKQHKMIGFLTLFYRGTGTVEAGLITPATCDVRSLLKILAIFQTSFFSWGKQAFITSNNPRAMKLVRRLGWQQESENLASIKYES